MDEYKTGVAGEKKILSVTELTCLIRVQLETRFPAVVVQGEVSNCTFQSSGHVYFTLKDKNSVLPCVMFRSVAERQGFAIETGRHYVVFGALRIYEPRGAYQLVVTKLEDSSREGELYREFLRRKEHFAALGYFAGERKKTLPRFPAVIGIVTSRTGAVIRDLLQVINRRCPSGLDIRLYPVRVQGTGAAAEIADGIKFFNENGADVIIIGRGGGSIEDLWAFNENEVVEAIYNSEIPVISAVGHETDFTLSDFTASLRAATPSVAAELCVPELSELRKSLSVMGRGLFTGMSAVLRLFHTRLSVCNPSRLQKGLSSCFQYGAQSSDYLFSGLCSAYKAQLSVYAQSLGSVNPRQQQQGLNLLLRENSRLLSEKRMLLGRNMDFFLQHLGKRLALLSEALGGSDFSRLLQKGFSVLTDEDGCIIKSVSQVEPNQELRAVLADGTLDLQVKESACEQSEKEL